jgi:predicted GIY-YIG superfamily endonuclease
MMLSVFFNWESYDDVHKAIGREKQLKGWGREKEERSVKRVWVLRLRMSGRKRPLVLRSG